jgi:hypothetical protein
VSAKGRFAEVLLLPSLNAEDLRALSSGPKVTLPKVETQRIAADLKKPGA